VITAEEYKECDTVGRQKAAKAVRDAIEERVHQNGVMTSGRRLSRYSLQYARKRLQAGLQTAVKDLVFTGRMKDDLRAGTINDNPAIGWISSRSRRIAEYQTEYEGEQIFRPNETELELYRNTYAEEREKCLSSKN